MSLLLAGWLSHRWLVAVSLVEAVLAAVFAAWRLVLERPGPVCWLVVDLDLAGVA